MKYRFTVFGFRSNGSETVPASQITVSYTHLRAHETSDYLVCRLLLEKPTDAIASIGYRGRQGEHMRVVENTADIHNIVVCTLCSCYPWPVLGLPPVWYKSAPYRSRVVSDPRSVLEEFGTQLAENVEIRVWDSTSEMRYFVLPEAPTNFQNKSLDELESMVTRNSMIGVEKIKDPEIRS